MNARAWYAWLDTAPPITWVLTVAECLLGYWLSTVGWPFAGGIIIGLAGGMQFSRVMRAIHRRQQPETGS